MKTVETDSKTKGPMPVLRATSATFVPNFGGFGSPDTLPSAAGAATSAGESSEKKTYYNPSQFYPQQSPFFFGYNNGAYYGPGTGTGFEAQRKEETPSQEVDTVVFKNLSFAMTKANLEEEIEKVVKGSLDTVELIKDKRGRFKGTAFVKFNSIPEAVQAKKVMQGMDMKGRLLKLEYLRPKGASKKTKKDTTPQRKQKPVQDHPSPVAELVPAEMGMGDRRKPQRRRGHSDMDADWRSKTKVEPVKLPTDPVTRAVCQTLVDFKKSGTRKPLFLSLTSVDHLKETIRVSKQLSIAHQIEEVTGSVWKVKYTKPSFFDSRGGGNQRFRSWSSEIQSGRSRGVKKGDDQPSKFEMRPRTRTFSREWGVRNKDARGVRDKERSESMTKNVARGPDGSPGFVSAGRGRS